MSIDLDAIQARADAATEGPWEADAMDAGHSRYEMNVWVAAGEGDTICDMNGLGRSRNESVAQDDGYKDAQFIANARTDVPALLAIVREQAAKLDELLALAHVADVNDQQFGDGNGGSLTTEAIRAALEARA